jgi:hypothetical protein
LALVAYSPAVSAAQASAAPRGVVASPVAGATQASPTPRGIIALNQYGQCTVPSDCGALAPQAASNPAVSGLMIRLNWKDVQTGPKTFDWDMTDNVFSQAGKDRFVVLSFVPGIQTPDWAMAEIPNGDKMSLCIPYGSKADVGQTRTFPKPWNAIYLNLWYDFLGAVAGRYAGKSQFWMVAASGPTSVSEEMSLPGAQPSSKVCPTSAGIDAWIKAGYTPNRYVAAWSQVFAKYAALFPKQHVSLALYRGLPIASSGGTQDPAQVRETPRSVIATGTSALGERFAVEANGLVSNSAANMAYQIVDNNSGKVVTGFDLATSAVKNPEKQAGIPDAAEALCLSLKAGVAAKVDYIEIYQEDASSGNPAVQRVLENFAKQLQAPRVVGPLPPREVPLERRRTPTSATSMAAICP